MPAFRFGKGQDPDRPARLRMEGGTIRKTPDAPLVKGTPGTLDLVEVAMGGKRVSGRFAWDGSLLTRL
jgi:hypothetical protein